MRERRSSISIRYGESGKNSIFSNAKNTARAQYNESHLQSNTDHLCTLGETIYNFIYDLAPVTSFSLSLFVHKIVLIVLTLLLWVAVQATFRSIVLVMLFWH